jgi:transglycosylase-like protein with SLT domain
MANGFDDYQPLASQRQRIIKRRRRIALGVIAIAVIALIVALSGGGSDSGSFLEPAEGAIQPEQVGDGYDRPDEQLGRIAAAGVAPVLFEKSADGVVESAQRTAGFRVLVNGVASAASVDADTLEAMVFLESGGRPDVIAGDDPRAATGLTQIVASTATGLLGMNVDIKESIKLTRKLGRALEQDDQAEVERLRAARIEADERFDPAGALRGAALYLRTAIERYGREDLAIASYHMGIGNLDSAIRTYAEAAGSPAEGEIRDVVEGAELTYARIFFDSDAARHPKTRRFLESLGDESAAYLWKVIASREIMRLFRRNPEALAALAEEYADRGYAPEEE